MLDHYQSWKLAAARTQAGAAVPVAGTQHFAGTLCHAAQLRLAFESKLLARWIRGVRTSYWWDAINDDLGFDERQFNVLSLTVRPTKLELRQAL